MMSQIWKIADSSKTQKSKFLKNEALSFLEIEKLFIVHLRLYNVVKKSFFSRVKFLGNGKFGSKW